MTSILSNSVRRTPTFSLVIFSFLVSGVVLAADVPRPNDRSVVEPQVKPAFVRLPPGAIEPRGWLRDWAVAAGDGITGHIDDYYEPFRIDWKGPTNYPVEGRPDTVIGLGGECCYWLDGLLALGYALHDDRLIKKATSRLDPVIDGVNRGAASFAYWRKDRPQGPYNNFGLAQMGRCLVTYYEATGDKRILDALVKAYAEFPTPMGHLEFQGDVTGLQNLEPLLEAYRFSGDRRLLDRAKAAIEAPDVQRTIHQWIDGKFTTGHSVCLHEQIRLPALYYPWSGDADYRRASCNAYHWVTTEHFLPYGLSSAEEFISGVGAFRLTETCNIMSHLWSSAWMYRIVGDASYGDCMERTMFNAAAAPIARDFKTASYLQSPNRLQPTSLPCGWWPDLLRSLPIVFPPCCHGALNRVIPTYLGAMWMATDDRGLAATLYGPCAVTAFVGEKARARLTCETAYPFDETVRVKVDVEPDATFPLYLRIPAWCAKPRISVNGSPADAARPKNGFVRIERRWIKGDVVTLTLPMSVEVARGYETEYPASTKPYFARRKSATFEHRRLPYASVSYGPLLFALPIADKDANTPVPGAKWQYALDTDPALRGSDIRVHRQPMPSPWCWPLDAPIVLTAPARSFDWHPTESQALPTAPVQGTMSETIRLVPYGCTKFRISMFPVTPKCWGNKEKLQPPAD
jgi:uncharacterized protein